MIQAMLARMRAIAAVLPYTVVALGELIFTQAIEHTIPRRSLGKVGPGVYIMRDVSFRFPKNIELGPRVAIGAGCRIWASANARILMFADAMLGPNVTILTASHTFDDRTATVGSQPQRERDVRIGEGVWIGANAVILPGATIGNGAIVAAGAVVTSDVEPFTVVGGVPARAIGTRGLQNSPVLD